MKEVAEAIERLVREEAIARILVAGDDVAMPLLREPLSPATLELLTEVGGVTLARRTDAEITFIEDVNLLAPERHVGAMLRYRV